MGNAKSLDERLAQIDTSDPDACWIWPGEPGSRGYGRWGKRGRLAHRAVYELKVGPIPDGYQIGHTCHDRADCAGGTACPHRMCVNWVRHLKPMTCVDNLLATPNTFNAINVAKDRCPQDHPYDEANTVHRRGRRHCRECDRQRASRYYHANLEKVRACAREYQRQRRSAFHT